MYCTNCGQTLIAETKFCSGCGKPIDASPPIVSQVDSVTQALAITTHDQQFVNTHTTDVTEEELRLFIGPNANRYLNRWSKTSNPLRISWNWAAVLTMYWMAYRKMYWLSILYFVIFQLTRIVGLMIDEVFTLLTMLAFGLWGNELYYRFALAKIRKIKGTSRDDHADALQAKISAAGHVSKLGLAVTIVGVIGVAWILNFI